MLPTPARRNCRRVHCAFLYEHTRCNHSGVVPQALTPFTGRDSGVCRAGEARQDVMADLPDFNAKLWSQNLSAVLDRNRDMAACRKLKQDIEQTLKKVADGILLFNEFNKKMEESQVWPSRLPSWWCLHWRNTNSSLVASLASACYTLSAACCLACIMTVFPG